MCGYRNCRCPSPDQGVLKDEPPHPKPSEPTTLSIILLPVPAHSLSSPSLTASPSLHPHHHPARPSEPFSSFAGPPTRQVLPIPTGPAPIQTLSPHLCHALPTPLPPGSTPSQTPLVITAQSTCAPSPPRAHPTSAGWPSPPDPGQPIPPARPPARPSNSPGLTSRRSG